MTSSSPLGLWSRMSSSCGSRRFREQAWPLPLVRPTSSCAIVAASWRGLSTLFIGFVAFWPQSNKEGQIGVRAMPRGNISRHGYAVVTTATQRDTWDVSAGWQKKKKSRLPLKCHTSTCYVLSTCTLHVPDCRRPPRMPRLTRCYGVVIGPRGDVI